MRETPVAIRLLAISALIFSLCSSGYGGDIILMRDSAVTTMQNPSADTVFTNVQSAGQDTLPPQIRVKPEVPVRPLNAGADFINTEEIHFLNSRTASGIFGARWGTVLHSFGTPVLNSIISAGGSFPGQTAILTNGFEMNDNRVSGFDLPVVLHEEIDSLEYISLPRSFLYGTDNASAAFNILRKGRVSPLPMTKIRYYEGPYGEAMIDAQFNKLFYNRVNFTLDIMNRKNDDRFRNSSGSIWAGRASAEYLFSDKWNAGINYFYAKSNVNNNLGVNADSVKTYAANFEEELYDELSAPVNDYYLYEKTTRHQTEIVLRGKPREGLYTTVQLYGKSYLREHRDEVITNSPMLTIDFIEQRSGVHIRQEAEFGPALAKLSWRYEEATANMENIRVHPAIRFALPDYFLDEKWNIFTGELSYELIAGLRAGVYARMNTSGFNNKQGFGAELEYISGGLSIYAGTSRYGQSARFWGTPSVPIERLMTELRIVWKGVDFGLRASGYLLGNDVQQGTVIPLDTTVRALTSDFIGESMSGGSFSGWMKQGIILAEASVSLKRGNAALTTDPLIDGRAGIYYNDVLFDSSLVLKTGFEVKYRSAYRSKKYSPAFGSYIFAPEETPSAVTLDFFTAGKVGENATVFFLWENLLDEKYYQMYLYPMPARGIVFGIDWEMFN
ncbi:MAG: hypothetical protein FMNOHCHN_03273 [Ignavibacteriaceae bacterium]|nr:hypothetical protein [Ignavibacteriaceae bacterium]